VTTYTRKQILQILEVEDGFLVALESEEIVVADAGRADLYSEQMLERVRVAHELVEELDVNIAGTAIIVRLREEMAGLRHEFAEVARELLRLREG
jgi:hypothetical protein